MKKQILLTGATGEIGASLANFFAKQKINLVLISQDAEKLRSLKKSIKNPKAKIITAIIDYNKPETYKNVEDFVGKTPVGLVLIPPKIPQTKNSLPTKTEWLNIFESVFVNPLEFLKFLLPQIKKTPSSKIALISGISSKVLLSNYAINGAIRSAWIAQVKAIASEYGKNALCLNSLSLGGVMTPSFIKKTKEEAKKQGLTFKKLIEEKTKNVPLEKYASLEDVYHAINALLGDFSNHITGQNLICDGGFIKIY